MTEISFSTSIADILSDFCFLGYRLVSDADRGAIWTTAPDTSNYLVPALGAAHNGLYIEWHPNDAKAYQLTGSGDFHIVRMVADADQTGGADELSSSTLPCSICMVEGTLVQVEFDVS